MSKKIKIGISILLLIIMISVHVSYAVDNQNEEDFFKVNKEEISPEETLEMTFDISSLKYNKFKILLKSNVDSEDIYTENQENISIDNNENVIGVDVDKEKISLNQIKLYYPIPKEMAIGTKIEFTAQIIVSNVKDENQTTNNTTVTNELEIDNSTQNLENEISQDNSIPNVKNEITLEKVVAGEITKTITVVEKKIEDNNNEGKNKNSNNNEQNSESNIPNMEKSNSNQEKADTQNEEKSVNNASSQNEKIPAIQTNNSDEKMSTSKTSNQTEKVFTSNQKISVNTNVNSNSDTNSEPQITYNGSNNNYLSKLEIEGIELNTSFNKENQTYFINVDNTNTINVVLEAEDSTAKINIAGNDTIQNGNNKILISVTAENGDVRYYRIFVNCEEGTDET